MAFFRNKKRLLILYAISIFIQIAVTSILYIAWFGSDEEKLESKHTVHYESIYEPGGFYEVGTKVTKKGIILFIVVMSILPPFVNHVIDLRKVIAKMDLEEKTANKGKNRWI